MNLMQNPPAIPIPAKSASDGLATASLVCGICGFILGPLTGIPSIITGHMALARAKQSGAAVPRKGKAIAGLILGYVTTALLGFGILAAASFAAGNAAIKKAKTITCRTQATALETSANNFFTEYGAIPDVGAAEVDSTSADGIRMLHILLGTESNTPPQNTRSVKFISVREGHGRRSGLIYDSSGTTLKGLFDPWGGSYTVLLDTDYDSVLVFTIAGKPVKLTGRRAAVYSKGPDRIAGTADDVMTW